MPAPLLDCGVVAIARHLDPGRVTSVADALAAAGVRAVEVTLNEPMAAALRAIETVATHANGMTIGAGTVLTIDAAHHAVDAGATFLVMPHTDPALIEWAVARGIPCLPGALTPTEIVTAWRAGAAAVKLFPASAVGPRFVRELAGPFPEIPLVPTGGLTVETVEAFIEAGAVAVGMGSWLVGDGEPDGVSARARRVVDAISDARRRLPR